MDPQLARQETNLITLHLTIIRCVILFVTKTKPASRRRAALDSRGGRTTQPPSLCKTKLKDTHFVLNKEA
jgi:hypothetical protein